MRKTTLFAAAILAVCALRAQAQPIDIGDRLELFVDRFLIERLQDAELRLHEPTPTGEVLRFDRPWEGRYCGYVSVFQDGDLFRMYYRGLPRAGKDGSDIEVTCYAESRDGVAWEKPNLGIHEVNGSGKNNVVLANLAPFSHNFSPFPDTRPGVPGEERYKALAGTSATGLVAFVSADGLHWRKAQDAPVITQGAFDSQNVAFWSATEGKYLCYFRTWSETQFGGFRTVSRATSEDFLHWSEPVPMRFGDTPPEHLYTNQTLPYFRAPHLYLALAARFMPGRRVAPTEAAFTLGGDAQYTGDCSDTVLLSSRGGADYDRTFMEGFVRPGIGLENWTSRTNYPARGVVPAGESRIAFYIQRRYGQDAHFLERMLLRADGFASVHAPYGGGELLTKPLRFTGKELALNVSTSAAGGVRVELQDEHGAPIPGFALEDCLEIIGDEIEHTVAWKDGADLSELAGKTVRLRVALKDSDLYALRFR